MWCPTFQDFWIRHWWAVMLLLIQESGKQCVAK